MTQARTSGRQQELYELADRIFNKLDWSAGEVLSWIAWRDPTLICEIPDYRNLQFFIWYPDQYLDGDSAVEARDLNPHDALLLALKMGQLSAIKDGTKLPRDYWCGKDVKDLWQVHFWRENILELWPCDDLRSEFDTTHESVRCQDKWLDNNAQNDAIRKTADLHCKDTSTGAVTVNSVNSPSKEIADETLSPRDAAIAKCLKEGDDPPRTIPWKRFCEKIRTAAGGYIDRNPALGFSDKQIERITRCRRRKGRP